MQQLNSSMWIYTQKEWPNFTWDTDTILLKVSDVSFKHCKLIGAMEQLGFDFQNEARLKSLTTEVLTTSAIEGETLDQDQVRSSIAKRLGMPLSGLVTSSPDIDGVVEMMLDATHNPYDPLSLKKIFDWHCSLFPTRRSGMRALKVGDFRTSKSGPMQVVSGAYGHEKVHFEAPPANRLKFEMTRFIEWFNKPLEPTMDLFVKSAIAHFWFVTIHPFEDGNGRIARALADKILCQKDGIKKRFYSMSSQIIAKRKSYYEALEKQQKSTLDITPWIFWFLECLENTFDYNQNILSGVLYKAKLWDKINLHPVNERQRLIINKMLEPDFVGFMNTSKYAKLAKCSTDTALRDITGLKSRGIFLQNEPSGRSTSYRLLNDLG